MSQDPCFREKAAYAARRSVAIVAVCTSMKHAGCMHVSDVLEVAEELVESSVARAATETASDGALSDKTHDFIRNGVLQALSTKSGYFLVLGSGRTAVKAGLFPPPLCKSRVGSEHQMRLVHYSLMR